MIGEACGGVERGEVEAGFGLIVLAVGGLLGEGCGVGEGGGGVAAAEGVLTAFVEAEAVGGGADGVEG